jgi:hemerythrin-like metal-binding protein
LQYVRPFAKEFLNERYCLVSHQVNGMPPDKSHSLKSGTQIPVWASSLSVGNAKLDEQHITLLELGRNLLSLLETVQYRHDQIHWVLNDIVGLSRKHEAFEEEVLEENGCPTLSEHKLAHEVARARLSNLLSDASHNFIDKAVLTRVIVDWMCHHISEDDLPVKKYMKMTPSVKAVSKFAVELPDVSGQIHRLRRSTAPSSP